MPISVSCSCGRAYRVASKYAGKKFSCKSCGERVQIPYDDADADDYYGEDDDYGYDTAPAPRPARRRTKSRSKRRRQGMPASVIIAIAGEGVLIPFNLLSALGNLISLNLCAVFFCMLRVAFEIACIIGFTKRQRQSRWASIILSAIGVVFFAIFLSLFLGNSPLFRDFPKDFKKFVIGFVLGQLFVFCVLIVSLLMPSTADYLDS